MIIDITGYVTELHGENGFKIKVTSDTVHSPPLTNLQVSKEVRIFISPDRYPCDNSREFKLITVEDKDRRDRINKFRSLSNALKMGDQVTCAVFVVEREIRNEVETYIINLRSKDIKSYADFELWLCPYDDCFKRLDVDSRESLKFRKQCFYMWINREKYKKITGSTLYSYKNKKWVNKNPKIIFPILWGIQVKTAVFNLWERFAGQVKDKPTTINTIVAVIGIIIAIIIAIWSRQP